MPYIKPETILEAKKVDLLSYLRAHEPDELVRCSGGYCTRTHDSLKISNGMWMWWSRGIGGRSALDYLVKVKGMDFTEAVQQILGDSCVIQPVSALPTEKEKKLLLPEKNSSNEKAMQYLTGRGISKEIIQDCIEAGLVYESLPYHNVVFIGKDEKDQPRYAADKGATEALTILSMGKVPLLLERDNNYCPELLNAIQDVTEEMQHRLMTNTATGAWGEDLQENFSSALETLYIKNDKETYDAIMSTNKDSAFIKEDELEW